MSSLGDSHIYTGLWVNWSHGLVLGSTLTLSARDGGLLTSFLATFITVVGAQLWRILSFCFHQLRSSRGPQDGLHHQHQNIFRNTTSPGSAAWSFLLMGYAWRRKTERPMVRSWPWVVLAVLYMSLFGILSVFQSQTTKAAGNERLVQATNCGYWRVDSELTVKTQAAFTQKTTNDTILAANYARACYGGSPDRLQCNVYPVQSLPYTTDHNATCPFEDGTCVYGNTAAFRMDTGLIDSHFALGINAPARGRVGIRKVTTCAPLHVKKFVTILTGNETNQALPQDYVWEMQYGNLSTDTTTVTTNFTFSYNTHTALDNVGYSIGAAEALAQFPGNAWVPIPALNRTDADISIIMINPNSMRFAAPNNDPVFGAYEMSSYVDNQGQNHSWYAGQYWVSVIACAEQHQICNLLNGACTPLVGSMTLLGQSLSTDVGLNPVQQIIMDRISAVVPFTSVYQTVYPRKDSALRAQETVTELEQAPIPDNQWMIEVSHWFETGLARLQRGIVEYATGPTNIVPGLSIYMPNEVVSKAMCNSQKITDPRGTISFSVLGVAIILGVGGLIIGVSLVLDTIVSFIQHRWNKGQHARLNWILDDKLQLQRMVRPRPPKISFWRHELPADYRQAFEGAGMEAWSGHTALVPTTEHGEKFGAWEDVDPARPTIVKTRSEERLAAEQQPLVGKEQSVDVQEVGKAI